MKEELPHQAVNAENAARKSQPMIDQQGANRRELNLTDQINKRATLLTDPGLHGRAAFFIQSRKPSHFLLVVDIM
jgi:hypothetical protein